MFQMDMAADRLGSLCSGRCQMAMCVGFGLCRLNGHMSSYIVSKPDADTGNISDGSEQEEEISPTFSKSSGSLSCFACVISVMSLENQLMT